MVDAATRPTGSALELRWTAIRGRMEACSDLLSRQGSVASRPTPGGVRVFSIRFVELVDGRRRQRAIYLGADGELVRRARALIATYRERERRVREVEEATRFTVASTALLRRMLATRRRGSATFGGS